MASEIGIYIITSLAGSLGAATAVTWATVFGAAVGIPLEAMAGVLGLSLRYRYAKWNKSYSSKLQKMKKSRP